MQVGDLIRDIRDGSMGIVTRTDDEYEGSDRYFIYWISGYAGLIGNESSEYLGSERKCAYRLALERTV